MSLIREATHFLAELDTITIPTQSTSSDDDNDDNDDPKQLYSHIHQRIMYLELQGEDVLRELALQKELRARDQSGFQQHLQQAKSTHEELMSEVTGRLTERLEKQIATIETLIKDKTALQDQVEELARRCTEKDKELDLLKSDLLRKYEAQLKKDRELWAAQEKVKREKWEADKIAQIRAQAFQQLEPTLQGLIDKNKEEVRKAVDDCEKRVDAMRHQYLCERDNLQAKLEDERLLFEKKCQTEVERMELMRQKERELYEKEIDAMKVRHESAYLGLRSQFDMQLQEAQIGGQSEDGLYVRKLLRHMAELEVELKLAKECIHLKEERSASEAIEFEKSDDRGRRTFYGNGATGGWMKGAGQLEPIQEQINIMGSSLSKTACKSMRSVQFQ